MVSTRFLFTILPFGHALAQDWSGWQEADQTVTTTIQKTKYVCPQACEATNVVWSPWESSSSSSSNSWGQWTTTKEPSSSSVWRSWESSATPSSSSWGQWSSVSTSTKPYESMQTWSNMPVSTSTSMSMGGWGTWSTMPGSSSTTSSSMMTYPTTWYNVPISSSTSSSSSTTSTFYATWMDVPISSTTTSTMSTPTTSSSMTTSTTSSYYEPWNVWYNADPALTSTTSSSSSSYNNDPVLTSTSSSSSSSSSMTTSTSTTSSSSSSSTSTSSTTTTTTTTTTTSSTTSSTTSTTPTAVGGANFIATSYLSPIVADGSVGTLIPDGVGTEQYLHFGDGTASVLAVDTNAYLRDPVTGNYANTFPGTSDQVYFSSFADITQYGYTPCTCQIAGNILLCACGTASVFSLDANANLVVSTLIPAGNTAVTVRANIV